MLPLTESVYARLHDGEPPPQEGFADDLEKYSPIIQDWLRRLSQNGLIAYIEADFWGAEGDQCAIVWRRGRMIMRELHTHSAFNRALRLFGVARNPWYRRFSSQPAPNDEFQLAGLGRCRMTDDWTGEDR
ncbi:MAG: hypothetical protein HYZ92_03510 [Candidatus Omnitrophica bacterium]|nr:hypothetical protein [Candidatus Omnitrophota bacterium]